MPSWGNTAFETENDEFLLKSYVWESSSKEFWQLTVSLPAACQPCPPVNHLTHLENSNLLASVRQFPSPLSKTGTKAHNVVATCFGNSGENKSKLTYRQWGRSCERAPIVIVLSVCSIVLCLMTRRDQIKDAWSPFLVSAAWFYLLGSAGYS